MDGSAFTNASGTFTQSEDAWAFVPNSLPPQLHYDSELTRLIAEAHSRLGELSGIGRLLPNPNLLITPYLQREAVLSSKIEGTQASLKDLLIYEARGEESTNGGSKRIREVSNHARALKESLARVNLDGERKPIDLKLIRDAHKTLLAGVRGEEKRRGFFRVTQNWLGAEHSMIQDARYVPPPPQMVGEMMMSLEGFIQHPPEDMPDLVQCALMHYQFEAIHPFADGNGRMGRLLISLFLCNKGLLSQPLLYLSAYFDKHREEYDDLMLSVSQKSAWNNWLKFFMRAIAIQSTEAIANVQAIISLMGKYDNRLARKKANANEMMLVKELFSTPIITTKRVAERLEVTIPTAQRAVDRLADMNILRQLTKGERFRVYGAVGILKLLT